MDDLKELVAKLHPLERKVVPLLRHHSVFSEVVKTSGLKDVEVMRALQWLQSKKVLVLKEDVKEVVVLGENGKRALEKGLPEKLLLESVKHRPRSLEEVGNETGLSRQELNACIGLLKSRLAININAQRVISITNQGLALLEKEGLEEAFLKRVGGGEVRVDELKDEERFAFNGLRKRKDVLKVVIRKEWLIVLSDIGKKLVRMNISSEKVVERLTPAMLRSGSWKGKEFRAYDIHAKVPALIRGKRHFVNQAIAHAKKIWLEMGFKEMTGSMIQTSFWNFDALFTAQDHPVRELQDTFFIKNPEKGVLPDRKLVERVKAVHENGGGTGSSGWHYSWSEEEARKNVLRTHTTVLSARTLVSLRKDELPAKFFAVGRCFRNETVDWCHLFEFNQTEGIVVDENANFRHLLGYLKQFFKKMGYEKARFRPAYFPYTEFSVEIEVFHPVHEKWVELGGAGILRPEVVVPLLGVDIPVLAWGPGFDRIILEFFGINDIRELYKNDLKQLRSIKEWIKQ